MARAEKTDQSYTHFTKVYIDTLAVETAINSSAAQAITSASANAFSVGPNGTTNPSFNIDSSTASAATGLNIKSAAAAAGVALSVLSSGTNESLTIDAKGSGTISLNTVGTGAVKIGSSLTITSASANAEVVGPNGATNPTWNIDSSTASAATGLNLKSAAAGSGVALSVLSSGSNENITLDAKGTGTIALGSTSTGAIILGRGAQKALIEGNTLSSVATQSPTLTAAQLLGGIIEHASNTGAGVVTLDTGTNISAAIPGVAVGDTFQVMLANTGTQTDTITTNTGLTLKGNATLATLKNAILIFRNTGANAWTVYITISA